MHKQKLKIAIQNGIQYLAAEQQSDGNFVSHLSTSQDMGTVSYSVLNNFTPALMLASLSTINTRECLEIRRKIATFLLSQKSQQWSYNYWSNNDPDKPPSYPDDLDDTFAALTGLYLHSPGLVDSYALAAMTKLLLATEVKVGGPYRTWLVSKDNKKAWLDVDIAVNINVAYFLSLITTPPQELMNFIEHAITHTELTSPYYPPDYPIMYYLSRVYRGDSTDALVEKLHAALQEKELSLLQRALIVSALLHFGNAGKRISGHIDILLKNQNEDGSWPNDGFFIDHYEADQAFYCGSNALTTAFVLEACALYQKNESASSDQSIKNSHPSPLKQQVVEYTLKQTEVLKQPSQNVLEDTLRTVANSGNGLEITAFAANFNQSLQKPLTGAEKLLSLLGSANLCGWAAYSIYDDFLDDEGKPLLLPSANIAMRLSYDMFLQAAPNKKFQVFVRDTFNTIDNANTWELSHCRFETHKKRTIVIANLPDYGDLTQLANRSIGHALAPLTILAKSGLSPDSTEFQAIHAALQHYIIAKQLNDDAHDWQEDFLRGHVTCVVALILKELTVPPGAYRFHELLPNMQRHFWHHTLITICNEMKQQLQLSRQELASVAVLKEQNVITKLLDSIEISIEDTLTKQAQTKQFLESF